MGLQEGDTTNHVTSCSHFPLRTLMAPTIAFTIDSLERNKKIIGAGRWSTKAATYPRGIATPHKTISSPAAEKTVSPPALHTPTIQSIQKELKG